MKFSEETFGEVKVFHLEGKIIGGPESQEMSTHLKRLVDAGTRALVMDFEKVQLLNSHGIGIIMACLTTLRNNGGDLCFANVHGAAEHYFEITRLDTVVKIFKSVEDGVANFSQTTFS
jgi:anti-anti-sigma factor